MWMWITECQKVDNLYENKEKTSQEQKTQGNSEFFIMNLKDNHNTWKFVLWLQHMLMYFQLLEQNMFEMHMMGP